MFLELLNTYEYVLYSTPSLHVAQNIVTSVKSIKVKSVKTNITFGEQSLVYVYCIKD